MAGSHDHDRRQPGRDAGGWARAGAAAARRATCWCSRATWARARRSSPRASRAGSAWPSRSRARPSTSCSFTRAASRSTTSTSTGSSVAEQLDDLDYWGTLEADGVSVVEWGDRFAEAVPAECVVVRIRITGDDSRDAASSSRVGARGDELARGVGRARARTCPGVAVAVEGDAREPSCCWRSTPPPRSRRSASRGCDDERARDDRRAVVDAPRAAMSRAAADDRVAARGQRAHAARRRRRHRRARARVVHRRAHRRGHRQGARARAWRARCGASARSTRSRGRFARRRRRCSASSATRCAARSTRRCSAAAAGAWRGSRPIASPSRPTSPPSGPRSTGRSLLAGNGLRKYAAIFCRGAGRQRATFADEELWPPYAHGLFGAWVAQRRERRARLGRRPATCCRSTRASPTPRRTSARAPARTSAADAGVAASSGGDAGDERRRSAPMRADDIPRVVAARGARRSPTRGRAACSPRSSPRPTARGSSPRTPARSSATRGVWPCWPTDAHLMNLAVAPARRGAGHRARAARRAVAARAAALGATRVTLEVRAEQRRRDRALRVGRAGRGRRAAGLLRTRRATR